MAKVTYLLGAGASANAMPIVSGFNTRLELFEKYLKAFTKGYLNDDAFNALPVKLREQNGAINEVVVDIRWLLNELRSHQTIDTLAKRFYLTNELNNLKKLKRVLILFFTIEQRCQLAENPIVRKTGERALDKRYDSFIATIAKRKNSELSLGSNIKMLTWNYDMQLEMSLKKYVQKSISALQTQFQIFPTINSFKKSEDSHIDEKEFGVIKLNGNAFWENPVITGEDNKSTLFDTIADDIDEKQFLGELIFQYKLLFSNKESKLNEAVSRFNFAWEIDPAFEDKHAGYDKNIEEAVRIAASTEYLVIIGYSFPAFNREIDKKILDCMTKLRKIYIQDIAPGKIKSTMENAFQAFQPPNNLFIIEFQLDNNTDQFIIPFEL